MTEDPKRRQHAGEREHKKHSSEDWRKVRRDPDSSSHREPRPEDVPLESPRRDPNDPREEEIHTRRP